MRLISGFKSSLPWWARIGAKLMFSRLPVSYSTWAKIGLYRQGSMDSADYAISIFESHVDRVGMDMDQLTGKKLLEIGPGDSCATAIIAHAYGASAILMDAGAFAHSDPKVYEPLCDALRARGLSTIDVRHTANLENMLHRLGARYITSGLDGWHELESASVDLVFSQAVLEHVRYHEFAALQQECARVMKLGAKASHQVDLKDHLGGGLNNLRFADGVWESSLFVNSGFYTNRIRFDQMIGMFSQAGFEISEIQCERWDRLPIDRKKLYSSYQAVPDDSLLVSDFSCVLLRP